ncbi:MAG: AraC family transcriptional regulator [Candidatus Thiodiazotropha sp. 6PLUC1]
MTDYYQTNTRFIPANYQAALLLEYARDQEIDCLALLRGTGLRPQELVTENSLLTPGDYLKMLQNLSEILPDRATSFMLGQQLLPGHMGNISHAMLHARNLRQALDILIRYQAWLSPLLAPHLMTLGEQTSLYWTDSCVNHKLRGFVVEMMMTAVTGMSRWLSGVRLPWRYHFNRTRPAYIEQYAVHLGTETKFNDYFDAMLIDNDWLDSPWPRGSDMATKVALSEVEKESSPSFSRQSLLSALYDYLHERVRLAPTLEKSAADFGISPATFKRHLAQHGSHFQAELDQVRTHITLQMMSTQGYNNEQIAAYLGFHDANNFRRSFKRWTGLTPSVLRTHLLQPSIIK